MTAHSASPTLPTLGFGVWQLEGDHATRLVRHAIEVGYDLIDTASAYGNEEAVGRALREAGDRGDGVTVTTKLWISDYDRVEGAVDESRRRLGMDALDLVLLHWPVPSRFERTLRAFDALSRLADRGLIARVGVSNFTASHLQALEDHSGCRPVVNQIEIHPFFSQRDARQRHAAAGIGTQAYSPLGGPVGTRSRPIEHPIVQAVAAESSATPAQVVLAWHRRHGVATIPRSSSFSRIEDNHASLRLELTPEQIGRIDGLDEGIRLSADPDIVDDFTFGQ